MILHPEALRPRVIQNVEMLLVQVPTAVQLADIFTKGLALPAVAVMRQRHPLQDDQDHLTRRDLHPQEGVDNVVDCRKLR